jgi:hypothetical protein
MDIALWLQALAVFIFHNRGVDDVLPVGTTLIALWCMVAFVYVLYLEPPPPPKSFMNWPERPLFVSFGWNKPRWV